LWTSVNNKTAFFDQPLKLLQVKPSYHNH
jgi:hypothetical protein